MLAGLANALAAKPAAVSYATISTALKEFGDVSAPPGFAQVTPSTQGAFWKASRYGASGADAEGVGEGVRVPLQLGRLLRGRVTLNHTHEEGAPQAPVVPLYSASPVATRKIVSVMFAKRPCDARLLVRGYRATKLGCPKAPTASVNPAVMEFGEATAVEAEGTRLPSQQPAPGHVQVDKPPSVRVTAVAPRSTLLLEVNAFASASSAVAYAAASPRSMALGVGSAPPALEHVTPSTQGSFPNTRRYRGATGEALGVAVAAAEGVAMGDALTVGAALGEAPALGEGVAVGVAVALAGGITTVSGAPLADHERRVLHTIAPPSSSASVALAVLPPALPLPSSGNTCTTVGRAAPPTGHRMDALVSPVALFQKKTVLPSTAASGTPLPKPAEGPALEDAAHRCSSIRLAPHSHGHAATGAPANARSSAKDST